MYDYEGETKRFYQLAKQIDLSIVYDKGTHTNIQHLYGMIRILKELIDFEHRLDINTDE